MSNMRFTGTMDFKNMPTFGSGDIAFCECKIIIAGEVIEECFTGTIEELKEKHPELND